MHYFIYSNFNSQLPHKLIAGDRLYPCALGRGLSWRKKEGDGKSVRTHCRPLYCFYRADRVQRPMTKLSTHQLKPTDGWCDTPFDANYNRKIHHPYKNSAEKLWRDDEIYDLIIVLDINDRPRIQGRGSALFMHIARPNFTPTAGCIALKKQDLIQLVSNLTAQDIITIQ